MEEEIPVHDCDLERALKFLKTVTDQELVEMGELFVPPEEGEAVVSLCSLELRQHYAAVMTVLNRALKECEHEGHPVFAKLSDAKLYNTLASRTNEFFEKEVFDARKIRQNWVIVEPIVSKTRH